MNESDIPYPRAVAKSYSVIPAKAGIHQNSGSGSVLDPRFRGDDKLKWVIADFATALSAR